MSPLSPRARTADDFAAIRARLKALRQACATDETEPEDRYVLPRQSLCLPPANETNWDGRMKAAVVVAVWSGMLGRAEAFGRYMLSAEELSLWEKDFVKGGISALQANSLWPAEPLCRAHNERAPSHPTEKAVATPRAADDVAAIRARMEELRREREEIGEEGQRR